MKPRIRIACLGAGGNTRRKHIPGFQAIEGVGIVGVVNRSRASSQEVADEFGIPRVYEQWEEALEDPEVDAVCIGTWPYMHAPMTIKALEAGKHVMCEARMAMNAVEAHAMLAASAARPDRVTQVVPSPSFMGPDAAVMSALDQGAIGDMLAVDLSARSGNFSDPDQPMSWRQDRSLSGLNIMGMGILYEAVMRWVGPARTVQAAAGISVPVRSRPEGGAAQVEVPDHLEVVGTLENGAVYRMQCSASTGFGPENAGWIYGTEGSLKVDFANKKVWLGKKGDSSLTDITPHPETWRTWRVEAEFVGAIRGEESVRYTTFEDGVRYMDFTQAVEDSRKQGVRVELPLK